tara:strand:+ start:346 stop:582 length:237 start_codon:yes stop_codon:yes gene_type:complete
MNLKHAIELLEYKQRWRQGMEDEMKYTPSQLTEALDIVIRIAKSKTEGSFSKFNHCENEPCDSHKFLFCCVKCGKTPF